MDWCCSSTPRTPEYRTMNEERHARKAYWLVLVRLQFLTGVATKGLRPSIPGMAGQHFRLFPAAREWAHGAVAWSARGTAPGTGPCLTDARWPSTARAQLAPP